MPDKLTWLQETYRQTPMVAMLVVVLVSGFYGYWVWGKMYEDVKEERNLIRKERDEYRAIADDAVRRLRQSAWRRRENQSANMNRSTRRTSRTIVDEDEKFSEMLRQRIESVDK